jgi:hypothetical protein
MFDENVDTILYIVVILVCVWMLSVDIRIIFNI